MLALVVGALATTADGRAAAAGWLPPVNASPAMQGASQFDLSLQDVVMDGEGNAVVVWVSGPEIVEAATRQPGGAWSQPVEVGEAGEGPLELKVAGNADGDAAAVWTGYVGANEVARAAVRPAGGDWSEPVTLSDPTAYAGEPDVAIDEGGDVTAVWAEGAINSYGEVKAATLPAGGEWGETADLSEGLASTPRLAVDPEGEVTAVWTLLDTNRDDGVIESKTRQAAGEWSEEAVAVSGPGALASQPAIAIDPQGDATAVWRRQDIPGPNGIHTFVQTARRTAGTWSGPFTLTKVNGLAGDAEVTVDPQGRATAIWSWFPIDEAGPRAVQVRSRAADGTWGATVNLVAKSGQLEPQEGEMQVAADADGNVTAIWQAWSAPNLVVRSAHLPAGGSWGPAVDVSVAGSYSLWPRVAVDPRGYATVVWSGLQKGAHAVRSRVFDPVAPELNDVTVPAGGVVGQAVTMSVEPFDLWSPVVTQWHFGDGGVASGLVVEHCFSTPGERTVTVNGFDLAGNTSSATRTISIAPDPALPAGAAPCGGPPPPEPPRPPDPPARPGADPDLGPAAPVISHLRQTNSLWRTPGAASRSRLPVGTSFRFRLDRAAQVRLEFLRLAPGRRPQARGVLSIAAEAGANVQGFRGRLGGRALGPGRYRLRLTALADGKTSAAVAIGFRIGR